MQNSTAVFPNIFQIPRPKSSLLAFPFFDVAYNVAEKALLLDKLNKEYHSVLLNKSDLSFEEKLLATMGISINLDDIEIDKIPAVGPLVIVANHPFGAIEGIILSAIIRRRRPDYKILANYILNRIPELRDRFIFVDPFNSKNSTKKNISPIKEALSVLSNGGALATFPSGEVSSFNLKTKKISDPEWNTNIARLAQIAGAQVITIYFHGTNSPLFQAAGTLHPRLRTAMLPKEFFNKRNTKIDVRISSPISAKKIQGFPNADELTAYLRFKTYLMRREFDILKINKSDKPELKQAKIATSPQMSDLMKEISSIEEYKLVESKEYSVYCVKARQAPFLMRELGIAREETFRAVGEGTGLSLDLDEFDDYYYHLLLWNSKDNKLAGAYRIGKSDEIILMKGINALYTSTLFKYSDKLFDKITPALELGRSFIRKEYQRSFAPLLLLWRAIGEFIGKNPKYTRLFGPVSLSKEYSQLSQKMITEYLSINKLDKELERYVKPRNKITFKKLKFDVSESDMIANNDFDGLSALISEIESDRKPAPALMKQYLKIGGRIISFNRDPQFSDVLDALILVDLTASPRASLERYFSAEALNNFLEYNNL